MVKFLTSTVIIISLSACLPDNLIVGLEGHGANNAEPQTLNDQDPSNNSNDPATGDQDELSATITKLKLAVTETCDELMLYIEEALVEYYTKYTPTKMIALPIMNDPFENATAPPSSDASSGDGSRTTGSITDVSKTNTQEAGVDELDWLKAGDSGNLFVAQGKSLYIVRTFPPESLGQQSKVDLDFEVTGLFLDETRHRVVVFGQEYQSFDYPIIEPLTNEGDAAIESSILAPGYYYTQSKSRLAFINIQDLAKPVITQSWSIESGYISSRMVENRIHLVTRRSLESPLPLIRDPAFQQLLTDYQMAKQQEDDALRDALRLEISTSVHEALQKYSIEKLLPQVTITTPTTSHPTTNALLSCADVLKPPVIINPPGLLTVTSFNTDGNEMASTAIMNNAWQTYASAQMLYVTQSSSGWFWRDNTAPQTAIYQFDISGAQPRYIATGQVDGITNNAFSYSEYNGYLRVATTESQFDSLLGQRKQLNNLFVLQANNGQLDTVGEVRGFAPDESIFSARFIGNKGFVVTFRQIDPLFSFDLSDPTNPQLMGELEIPGFSTYMHPIDDSHLLTIGRTGTENGAGNAVQLQIFDIADLTNPQRTAALTLFEETAESSSWSPADYDHRAFTYYAPRQTLAIPVNFNNWQTCQQIAGIGLYAIDVSAGIREIGLIDHNDVDRPSDSEIIPMPEADEEWCYSTWEQHPQRTVFIDTNMGTFIYTLSQEGIKVVNAERITTTLNTLVLQ